MFNFFTANNNFPTKIFVITSLLSLFLFGGIITILSSELSSQDDPAQKRENNKTASSDNEKDFSKGDPLITEAPRLKNMLKGPITDKGDPALGPAEAPITIVEFSDYKCGVCQDQQKILKKIRSAYNDKVQIIWKDYPVADKNSLSFKAARAARCAGEQGGFWEYNKELYKKDLLKEEKQQEEVFAEIAKNIDLNSSTFSECLEEERVDGAIMDNIKEADALGISGIPFIYVNDQEVMGEISYEELKRMVDIELRP